MVLLVAFGSFVLLASQSSTAHLRGSVVRAAKSSYQIDAETARDPELMRRAASAETRAANAERAAAQLQARLQQLERQQPLLATHSLPAQPGQGQPALRQLGGGEQPLTPAQQSGKDGDGAVRRAREAYALASARATSTGSGGSSTARLAALCAMLAPAVALRPAPSRALSSRLVVRLSPYRWALSPADLEFDPDGVVGALTTPWGSGRWGSIRGQPATLWAHFAGRTHLLRVHGNSLTSHRCADNRTELARSATAGGDGCETLAGLLGAITASNAAIGAHTAAIQAAGRPSCKYAVRHSPWVVSAPGGDGGGGNGDNGGGGNGGIGGAVSLVTEAAAAASVAMASSGVGCMGRGDGAACEPFTWACAQSFREQAERSYEVLRVTFSNGSADAASKATSSADSRRPAPWPSHMLLLTASEMVLADRAVVPSLPSGAHAGEAKPHPQCPLTLLVPMGRGTARSSPADSTGGVSGAAELEEEDQGGEEEETDEDEDYDDEEEEVDG